MARAAEVRQPVHGVRALRGLRQRPEPVDRRRRAGQGAHRLSRQVQEGGSQMKIRSAALSAIATLMAGAGLWSPAFAQGQPAATAKPATPVATTAPAVPPVESAPLPPNVDPAIIDAALKAMVDDKRLIGVSALVFERGREAYFGAFGLADRENNKPMTRDTVVQIFSMTKPVVGVALMQMYERGKFQLDDPLSNYLPEFANVTVYAGQDANGQPKFEPPKRAIPVRDI